MAKDRFHNIVRNALEKDDWKITADPYEINVDDVDFEIDLAAEQLLGAEREGRKIAVEIKSFISPSNVSEFHTAYRLISKRCDRLHTGLFHSHLARLRINSESNSESRLKTTEKRL